MARIKRKSLLPRIGPIMVYASDFQKMFLFYRDVLGLRVARVIPGKRFDSTTTYAKFKEGSGVIELIAQPPAMSVTPPAARESPVVIAFGVRNIDRVYEELKKRNVDLPSSVTEVQWGWFVNLKDPENNTIQIHRTKPGHSSA